MSFTPALIISGSLKYKIAILLSESVAVKYTHPGAALIRLASLGWSIAHLFFFVH